MGAYLFRWIIIYAIIWYFTWSLHRELDPSRNRILHARWCIHPYLENREEKDHKYADLKMLTSSIE
jgi:hypothetical protein